MKGKKILKVILLSIICFCIIFFAYNLLFYIRSGNQEIKVITASNYFNNSNLDAKISVFDEDNNKIKSNLKVQLLDAEGKKVNKTKEKYTIKEGQDAEISIKLPDKLQTGNYKLEVTSKSGIKKDVFEIPVNIIEKEDSNITISLDKGIYKPGDIVNFRALITSKKDFKPVEGNISVSIYDGKDNKVYSNETKTTEYGIVSGNFTLADEVNSGTYKLVVSNDVQEVTKVFTVNPYVTPKFEVSAITDKEVYKIGDEAIITLDAKYFFGEPVKEAKITGTIGDREIEGFTDSEGKYTVTHTVSKTGKEEAKFEIVDSSNYLIEASKTIVASKNNFEIELLPEYGSLMNGINNDIYVFAKKPDGTPLKTYTTIQLGTIKREIITDENGIGKFTLTSNELNISKNNMEVKISSKDMNGNEVNDTQTLKYLSNYGTIIKTDKVKYNEGDDIEITLKGKESFEENEIYIFKNNELLQIVSFEGDTTKINLENISGVVDIYVLNNNYTYYTSKYNKKTIFIKPSQKLNISLQTDSDTYLPGDNLNIKFTTKDAGNNVVDSALLVSILDEAILNLAENDLSIDNIKLALSDIELDEGITATDLYTNIIDESSEMAINGILLKQKNEAPDIEDKTITNEYDKEIILFKLIISVFIFLIISIIYTYIYDKKYVKAINNFIVSLINIIGLTFILVLIFAQIYLVTDIVDIFFESIWGILAIFILTIAIYLLFLYKKKDYIFKNVKKLMIDPLILIILVAVPYIILTEIFLLDVEFIYIILLELLIFLFLIVYSMNPKREKLFKLLKKFIKNSVLGAAFWFIALFWLEEVSDEPIMIILCIIVYMILDYLIFGRNSNKKSIIQDGKIVLNITIGDGIRMILSLILIIIFLLVGAYIYEENHTIQGSMGAIEDYNRNSSVSFEGYDTDTIKMSAADNATVAANPNPFKNIFEGFSSKDEIIKNDVSEENKKLEIQEEVENKEQENKVEENVRNVFLESLAFIPELITENGNAELNIPISDNITTWNIQVVGNSKEGDVGFTSSTFKVFKEFFVDFSLPTNAVVTDKVSIPVTLYNYTENELAIDTNVVTNDWSIIGEYTKNIVVPAKSTSMIYVPIEILKAGNNTLRIETKAGTITDIVEKNMTVNVNGLEINELASSGIIQEDFSQDIIFDEKSIDNLKTLKLKLYPSAITQAIENIDAMLKMPTGCFEQTSSSLYPDILVLQYLKNNKMDNEELREKALDYISKGYQKLLTYEVEGEKGGYSLYGNAPAEPVITAFGLMELNDATNVYDVDEKVINNMIEYLFKEQKVDGSFNYSYTNIGGASSRDKIAMNAYIIWALSEVCPEDTRLAKSISYLENKIEDVDDTYTLALIANVFANTKNKNSDDVIDELLELVVEDKNGMYLTSEINDYYGTARKYQNIQATALTSLALSKLNTNNKINEELVNYLIENKYNNGSWGTTQSTVLALKAINESKDFDDIENQTITIKVNDEVKEIKIENNTLDVYELDFENVSVENNVTIEMKKGKICYEIVKQYYKDYNELELDDNSILIENNITEMAKVNDVITQNIKIINTSDMIRNGLVQINIPQGCSVLEESLSKLEVEGKIDKYEYNYGKINLYIRNFEQAETIDLQVNYRANYPVNITGGAVKIYDYYNPDIESVCLPVNISIVE